MRARLAPRAVAVALMVFVLAYCSDYSVKVGHTWELQSVDLHVLPDTLQGTEPEIVITSARALLNGDGSYTVTFTGSTGGVAGDVGADHGTWTTSGSTFVFHSAVLSATTYNATQAGATFDVALPGQIVGATTETVDMFFSEVTP